MHRQLTFRQACERLRIPEQTLRDAVKYGEVPCRRQGDEVVFDADELAAWGSRRILALRERDLLPEHAASTRLEARTPAEDTLLPQLLKPAYVDLDFRAKTRKSVIRVILLCGSEPMISIIRGILRGVEAVRAGISSVP